ncbi:MAG: hypothetical protein ACFB4I_08340 [Cyanophyceae cyanobacterium]
MKKTITILLVESDDEARRLFKTNLSNWGYRVVATLDEEDAIERAIGRGDRPDIILINQVGISLEETRNMVQRICEQAEIPSSTPVVILAEQYGADLEGRDTQVGENEYISYLEDGQQLLNLLEFLCGDR